MLDNFEGFDPLVLIDREKEATVELIRRTQARQVEHGAAVIIGGTIIHYFDSDNPEEVDIPIFIEKLLDTPLPKITLLHSHTNGTLHSVGDLGKILRMGVEKVIVTSINRNTFSAGVGSTGMVIVNDGLVIDEVYLKNLSDTLARKLSKRLSSSNFQLQEILYMLTRERLLYLKKHYNWNIQGGIV